MEPKALTTKLVCLFFSSRRRHTRCSRDWSSDVCSSDLQKWQDKDFQEESGELLSLDQYMDEFDKCIKCYGCREACPICHCVECTMEMESPEWVTKGELPPGPMFHLIRLVHIADSCTNCGQCEEVCPAEIPLARIWHKIGI